MDTTKTKQGATAEYPATIVPDSTCAHIFKERVMCRNKLTQVAGYSAVKLKLFRYVYEFFERICKKPLTPSK